MISNNSKSNKPDIFFGGGSTQLSGGGSIPLYMAKSPLLFGGGSTPLSIEKSHQHSVEKSYPLSGGGSTSSEKDIPKNDLEEGFKIGFNDGYVKGLEARNKSDKSSFDNGYVSCYMKHVLFEKICLFDIPSLVSSILVNNDKNIEISIKGIINNSFLHILSISVVFDDSLTYIVNAYECSINNGERTNLYEKIYFDMDNFIIFLSDKINEYLNSS